MPDEAAGGQSPSVVRPAERADLAVLADVEAAGDAQFAEHFGRPTGWDAPPTGAHRASEPGFLLVAEVGEQVVGFAHVLQVGGLAHLEQLSVLPEHQRRGLGATLVRRVLQEAARRGYREVSLATYADVLWNGPFYARLGFVEAVPRTDFHRRLVAREQELGLDRLGRRTLMTCPTTPP